MSSGGVTFSRVNPLMSECPVSAASFLRSGKVLIPHQPLQLNEGVGTLPSEPVPVEANRDLFRGRSMSVGNRTLIEGRVPDGILQARGFQGRTSSSGRSTVAGNHWRLSSSMSNPNSAFSMAVSTM